MNFLTNFPNENTLFEKFSLKENPPFSLVNGHIHTPYSFSSFSSIPQALELARNEKVSVLGINDFYVTDGYGEFHTEALKSKVFPLFNIEFMALQKDLQTAGVKVNDPNNPGRTYFSGKGLSYPVLFNDEDSRRLLQLKEGSNAQAKEMIRLLNLFLLAAGVPGHIDYTTVKARFARELVRERHIAKALRELIYSVYSREEDRHEALALLMGRKGLKLDLKDVAVVENEIRGALLKADGPAFVAEDDQAFYSLEEIQQLILNGGGIPCYPVLLDDKNGKFTDFEADWGKMASNLVHKRIYCIELIPGRNSLSILNDFVHFFHDKGFVILFGTEHNTPDLQPLSVSCRGQQPLTDELNRIGYEGACVIAAHQYLHAQGKEGYVTKDGVTAYSQRDYFVRLGQAVLTYFNDEFRTEN